MKTKEPKFKIGDEVIHLGHGKGGPYFDGTAFVIEVDQNIHGTFIYKTDVIGCYIYENELKLAPEDQRR